MLRKLIPPRLTSDSAWGIYEEQPAPCLQEKCAMWRNRVYDHDGSGDYTSYINGFCGLAGKP
jgi:hypothetical protein